MKRLLLLTKVLAKNGTGMQQNNGGKKKSLLSKIPGALLYIFLGLCCIPIVIAMYAIGWSISLVLNVYGMADVAVELSCSAGVVLAFIFGITMIISVFYYTSDVETLLALPFKPREIVGAKFIVTWVYESITIILVIFPVLIGYGAALGESILFYIMAFFACIMMSVLPLVYGGVISMIIMRVFKRAKNRDFITGFTSAVAIIFVLGINMFSSEAGEAVADVEIADMAASVNGAFTGIMNKVFPPLIFIEKGLADTNPVMFIWYIAATAVFVIAFIFIAEKIYFKGAIGMSETSSKREKISATDRKKIIRRENKFKSYVKKELKIVFRTPVYFMNCAMIQLIWPVFLLIPLWSVIAEGELSASLAEIRKMAAQDGVTGICIAAAFLISGFVSALGGMSSTAISREGKNFAFIKYIPMSYKVQVNAKVVAGIIVSLIASAGYGLIAMLIVGVGALSIFAAIITCILTCTIFNYLSIILDLIRPKLNWENENSIKQNFNIIINLFVEIVICVLFMAVGTMVFVVTGTLSEILATAVTIALLAAICAAVYFGVTALAEYRVKKLQ